MKPELSYTIWFSQRTGSTLLCQALEATGIAARPREWLLEGDLLERYGARDCAALREALSAPGASRTRPVGRNAPCPCGSGRKYEHCCLRKDRSRRL